MEEIIDAGRFAPSSLNTQPWKFVVITDKKLIVELSLAIRKFIKRLYPLLPFLRLFIKELKDDMIVGAIRKTATSSDDTVFYGAPALVIIASDRKDHWVAVNCALAAQNMMLAAYSLGIGSCFIGRGDVIERRKRLLKKVGIEKGYKIQASMIFGYVKDDPKSAPHRKSDNILSWK